MMEMAFRAAAATARPSFPHPQTSLICAPRASLSSKPTPPTPRPQFSRPTFLSLPKTTAISVLALFTASIDAKAISLSKEQIASSLTQVENTIDKAREVGSGVLGFSQRAFQVLVDALKPGVDVALPVLQKAGDRALQVASPVISEATKKAQEAIQSSGFDTEPVVNVAKSVADAAQQTTTIIEGAKPIASSTVETISSADPVVIVEAAGALFLAYLLLPPIWSAISFSLRGFKGELTPAQTLDLLCTQKYLMIDIRSEKDKSKSGIPRLPSSAKNKMRSIPLEELPSKLRGIVRNVKKAEAEITALKISYLKRISKGSSIVIMDTYSDSAKIVARALTNLGFKNCWVMADGFSGNRGWLQSRLGTDSYNLSVPEVLSPSRIIPAAVRSFGTTNSRATQSSQKLLPGSAE